MTERKIISSKSKIAISILLIFTCLVCMLTFAGCGALSVTTVKESLDKMNTELGQYTDVLTKDDSAHNTINYYKVHYGTVVDGLVNGGAENYADLQIYNSIFSIAMSYIEENHAVITNLTDEEANDATKNELDNLNSNIESFTNEIKVFVESKKNLENFFNEYGETMGEADKLAKLREFKREYSNFVNKSVVLASSLSSAVNATGVLNDIENVELIKNFICNKVLSVYNEFFIVEMGNFNWQESSETATKTQINGIISSLKNAFTTYLQIVSLNDSSLKTLTAEELKSITNQAESFMTEANNFFEALQGLDIENLAVNYLNDIDKYVEDNNFAAIYLEKIEQFVNYTLPNYLSEFRASIAN